MNSSAEYCSVCGEQLPRRAKSCKHCGSSDADGWNDSDDDLLDDDFDYDEFVEDEFSGRTSTRLHPMWKAAAILLLLAFVLSLLAF